MQDKQQECFEICRRIRGGIFKFALVNIADAVGMSLSLAVSMGPGLCYFIIMISIFRTDAFSGGSGDDVLSLELDNFNLQHLRILLLSQMICDGQKDSAHRLKLPQPEIQFVPQTLAI